MVLGRRCGIFHCPIFPVTYLKKNILNIWCNASVFHVHDVLFLLFDLLREIGEERGEERVEVAAEAVALLVDVHLQLRDPVERVCLRGERY